MLLLGTLACGGAGGAASDAGTPAPSGFSTVAIVVLENENYENVVGASSMPFLNSLIAQGALATNYLANAHPSLPNYFVLTVGQTETDSDSFSGTVTDDNIVRRVAAASKTWKGYFESIPGVGYLGDDSGPYIRHHNPFAYLSDVQDSPQQAANVVPLTQLAADIASNQLPNYVFIVPDDRHNSHDCPSGAPDCSTNARLSAADEFLSANVGPLLNSPGFRQRGLLIVTWDEGAQSDLRGGGGHIATVLVGARVKPGFRSTSLYQHQSVLRTTAEALGLTMPDAVRGARGMGEFFQ